MKHHATVSFLLLFGAPFATSFCPPNRPTSTVPTLFAERTAAEEAQRLLERSRALRAEIEKEEASRTTATTTTPPLAVEKSPIEPTSKWSGPGLVPIDEASLGPEYRLYVDIGREEGTWMEPRWGASGKRIEFTVDVRFNPTQPANEELRRKMVQDNKSGSSTPVCTLDSALLARLRSGFDEMKCQGGAFRIDKSQKAGQSDTLRFYINVEGTPERGSNYGDLFIPEGALYFSIPCFGSVQQLSSKGEMPVTVRQMGWHTGWRREESRILGIFKAVPIDVARQRDGF